MAKVLEDNAEIAALLASSKTIAVLGIKTEAQADQPAFYVPVAAQAAGYRVIPVPVYYPEVTTILGEPVFRSVAAIGAGKVDIVDVFRKPSDLAAHLDDLIAARPRAVWLQLGIRNEAFAAALVKAGIDVVEDRCLLVELRRTGARAAG
ncbi:MAG: CoA-binding protein [Polyangiaceae bacterium]